MRVKERTGDDRGVLPQESCDFVVGVTARAVGTSTQNCPYNKKGNVSVARADDLGIAWQPR